MIRCNLSILLAERDLRITKVSNDTGISRTTLTSLANNRSQGIQLDTINTLCNYLQVGPEKLISYVPVEIKVNDVEIINNNTLNVKLEITKNSRTYICYLTGDCYTSLTDGMISGLDISIDLYDEKLNNNDEDIVKDNLLLIDAFSMLSIPFINDIEEKIVKEILLDLDEELCTSHTIYFTWDKKLISK